MSVKKYHADGKGSFSYQQFTFFKKSWFANANEAYQEGYKFAETEL